MEMKLAKRLIELDTLADKLKIELKAAELEITAIKEALEENYAGYLMWNPSNVYKAEALEKEAITIVPNN